jgi:hypothetical protein
VETGSSGPLSERVAPDPEGVVGVKRLHGRVPRSDRTRHVCNQLASTVTRKLSSSATVT